MAELKKATTAVVKKGIISRAKSSIWALFRETWDEVFQLVILHQILGIKGGGKMEETKEGEARIPKVSRLFHVFSDEDEIKWNKLFAEVRKQNPEYETKFMIFMKGIVLEGYDEDTLRIRLIGSFSQKNEDDPAIQTAKSIAEMDGDLDKQIEFAKYRKLLVRKSFKRFVATMGKNKIASLLWAAVVVLLIIRTCSAIFG